MRFSSLGHLLNDTTLIASPGSRINQDLVYSPEIDIRGAKGYLASLLLTSHQVMGLPARDVRRRILSAAVFLQDYFDVEIIHLGALTPSVTDGGLWMTRQARYAGFVTHGHSYTAAVTCQAVMKAVAQARKDPGDLVLAIVGATEIIGEAVTLVLSPRFHETVLVARRINRLHELSFPVGSNSTCTGDLDAVQKADVIVTATSFPDEILVSHHLKRHAIVVDVSQPPNLSPSVCQERPDICRVDGGLVDIPGFSGIPGLPPGKSSAGFAEVIMQTMEDEKRHHVGSVDLSHLKVTERWAETYGFVLAELTNFGKPLIAPRIGG
ncbi:MAG: hypothetical protein WC382_07860 [Methanoregulaceae archaeon]